MTRKHYIALAKALASTRPSLDDYTTTSAVGNNTFVNHITFDAARAQWRATRDALSFALATTNPLFDRERFVAATEA